MYEVNVMVYGVGEDLGYKRYCSNDELEQLLRPVIHLKSNIRS